MAKVELGMSADGAPGPTAKITMHGRVHEETVTPGVLAEDELVHVWLSKEKPENEIEMIVYNDSKPLGRSKLVNNKMPFGKEMWGSCEFK